MTHVVVIGDVHGNARALRSALAVARSGPLDRLVFLGDLLTYGHDVRGVLELVGEAQQALGAELIVGNHDQMYFDLARGERDYFERLPPWIRDSVELTLQALDMEVFEKRLAWCGSVTVAGIHIAHADPFDDGKWSYIASESDHQRAARALAETGFRAGVFGHTHRTRWYVGDPAGAVTDAALATPLVVPAGTVLVANAGAIGQPRDQRGIAAILRLEVGDEIRGIFERVDYDVEEHVEGIRNSGLPTSTIERLCAFFNNARRDHL